MGEIVSAGLLEAGDVFRVGSIAPGVRRVYQVDTLRHVRIADDRADIRAIPVRRGPREGSVEISLLAGTPVEKLEQISDGDVLDALACLAPGDGINVVRWGMGYYA